MKNKSCSCGCGTCSTEKLTLKESKSVISEVLDHHVSRNIPLHESTINHKSREYFDMWKEARYLYSRGLLNVGNVDQKILKETRIGEVVKYKGKQVPLDYPIINEQKWGIFYGDDQVFQDFESEEEAKDYLEGREHNLEDYDINDQATISRGYMIPNSNRKNGWEHGIADDIEIRPLNEYFIFKQPNKEHFFFFF